MHEWLFVNNGVCFAGNKGITDKGAARLIQALATNLSVTNIDLSHCE